MYGINATTDSYTDYLHSYTDCKQYLHSSTALAFVDGLQRTCVFEYRSLAFVYELERRVYSSTDYNSRSYYGIRAQLLRELYWPDDKHTWAQHISEVKKSFANKLNLLERSSFLSSNILLDLYFKIVLPSVFYALPIWGSFTNKDGFLALESLHWRAANLIYGLKRDMPTTEVLKLLPNGIPYTLCTKSSWQH